MRSSALVLVLLGCAPHDGDESPALPSAPGPAAPERAQSQPEIRPPALLPLEQALQEFPEDRQELTFALRARTHRCCYWGADTSRITSRDGSPPVEWVGPRVPPFVAPKRDGMTLNILDPHRDGWLAFYRELYGDPGCEAASKRSRCEFAAVLFDEAGRELWQVKLDALFSAPGVQIDDLHWHDGVLYFNEACPMGVTKHCGAIVAYDPAKKRVKWRSRPSVSDDAFRIADDRIVAVSSRPFMRTPGGTGSITVLDRRTGRTLAHRELDRMVSDVLVHRDVIDVDATTFVMEAGPHGLQLSEIPRPDWFAPPRVGLYR